SGRLGRRAGLEDRGSSKTDQKRLIGGLFTSLQSRLDDVGRRERLLREDQQVPGASPDRPARLQGIDRARLPFEYGNQRQLLPKVKTDKRGTGIHVRAFRSMNWTEFHSVWKMMHAVRLLRQANTIPRASPSVAVMNTPRMPPS